MAKNKRSAPEEAAEQIDDIHPSRRKRVKYSEEDAQSAKVYNDLADEVQAVRLKAAGTLLQSLSTRSPRQIEHLNSVETRLIRGLCSGRKAARLGYSVALAEVLRLRFQLDVTNGIVLGPTIDKVVGLSTTEGNPSGQEQRDHLLGRRAAFQAVLQSDVGLSKHLSDGQWRTLLDAVYQLAAQKPWVRRECGAMLHEYLVSDQGSDLDNDRVQAIVETAASSKMLKTPEGVGLWLTVQDRFKDTRLPKGIWHHNDPLSSHDRAVLSKVMLENASDGESGMKKSGARQTVPSFAWETIFSTLYRRDDQKRFAKFWDSVVVSTMFSSAASTDRKSLGLQITTLAVSTAPSDLLRVPLSANVLRCVLDQRAKPDRYLFDAAKIMLNRLVARAKADPNVAGPLMQAILDNGAVNFDQLTKTKTVESLIAQANDASLNSIAEHIRAMLGADSKMDHRRSADILLLMVRLHKSDGGQWLGKALETLSIHAYGGNPAASIFRSRLMSCLNSLMEGSLEHAIKAPVLVVRQISNNAASGEQPEAAQVALTTARKCLDELSHRPTSDPSSMAFSLLLALSILQVYNKEPDALGVLDDLVTCYQSREGGDAISMVVELLLSFISKPSALYRKLAEQVFSALAAELTADGLQSFTDILGQKESLSGQQELFDQHDDGDEDADSKSDKEDEQDMDVEAIEDVEDGSDIELVNGDVAEKGPDDDSASESSEATDDAHADGEDDEEAVFDRKLADALGTAGMDADSDDDGSDMDDEQMMALEPHLVTIFKQRQQVSSKKQEKQDAKENIVNFKNRVLDLLMIYVKSQFDNILALDLILPLATLVRTTSSKSTAEKAFAVLRQYFESCTKKKSLPRPDDQDVCFEVLTSLHDEMKLGGSKLHAAACSRSSLFICKVLVAIGQENFERAGQMYAQLHNEWFMDPSSKVQGSIFTEWISWSITARKHA